MAEYLIQSETLDDIADAINAKTGGSAAMTPAEMADAIGRISSGGDPGYHFERYTGTVIYSDEYVPKAVVPVDARNSAGIWLVFKVVRTGSVSDGAVTYDDVPLLRGSNVILGYGISYLKNAPDGRFTYRYGSNAPASGETASASAATIAYRAGTEGVRVGTIAIGFSSDDQLSENGIKLDTQNGTRAYCRAGVYMEFEYECLLLKEASE